MAIGAFPLAKLGALLLKQISKPLANAVKNRAKTHPTFRTYVCMPPAQFYNWCEVQFKMWLLNLGKPVEVPKLNENQAIELGANILGEGIIFTIAAVILILEYMRQVKKETAKEENRIEEINSFKSSINDLFFDSQKTNAEIKELMRHIHYLESELKKFPPPPPSSPKQLPPPLLPLTPSENVDSKGQPPNLPPTNINYVHKQFRNDHVDTNKQNRHGYDSKLPVKSGSILSAISYLENEIILASRDKYIEEQESGVIMNALEYLDKDVFKNDNDNDVIFVLRNAPYASRLYY